MPGFNTTPVLRGWECLTFFQTQAFLDLQAFVLQESASKTIYPPQNQIFNALEMTSLKDVRVVILGQDPYHGPGQAMGLSFSVNKGIALPKSLSNIYKELYADLGITRFSGDLTDWAKQGVLLLNTILTVEAGKPLSHQDVGWELFTDEVIRCVNALPQSVIFVLWGKAAQAKETMIDKRHLILKSAHPSPLSAYRGFFGSKPFSKINEALVKQGGQAIDWSEYV